ncbi:MAG: response regulator transcription factor [Clostridiales bacterium]|nr:response regulator transcription factor [Clostridiales bacterium]
MQNILVVEDDKALNQLMCAYLSGNGYKPTACYDGEEAFVALSGGRFDLVISDIMMPKMDGFELVRRIRLINDAIPILFLTAKDDKTSQLLGYKLGVDDYLVKPFDMDVLMLRVAAILRRSKIEEDNELRVGNLVMNKQEHTAYVDGEELKLTVREFDLLFKFLSYPKRTFTRAQLMDEFWDFDSSAMSRTVDVYLARLRDKTSVCDGFEIVTVHGLGYKAVLK